MFRRLSSATLLFFCVAPPGAAGVEEPRRPNILFIMTDQHRLDATGAYGNKDIRTPNLDRLAGQGLRFVRYYIAAFPCSPSRASLLTGLHPQTHGVVTNGVTLDPRIATFGTELSAAGYRTAWMGKWHLRGRKGFVRGSGNGLPRIVDRKPPPFDRKKGQNGFQHVVSDGPDYVNYLKERGLDEPRPGKKVRGGHHTVIEAGHSVIPEKHFIETFLTDRAIRYLENHAQAPRPFCLCVSYEGPHRPITPPVPWDRMYEPTGLALPATLNDPMGNAPKTYREFHWRMYGIDLAKERSRLKRQLVFQNEMWDLLDRAAWTEREYRELTAHYYGYISYLDAQIGRLLEALGRLNLTDRTVVVYTTDHGEFMGGHGCIFKGMMMYDDLMRVPLMVRYPGFVPKGRVSRALASSVDLMPTLLDFAGVKVPETVHGKSLRPIIEGRTDKLREAVFTSFPTPRIQMRMIRTERYKHSFNWKPRQANELYDMQKDPLEMNNLAGRREYEDLEQKLRQKIYGFMDRIRDPWRDRARTAENIVPLTRIQFDFDAEYEREYWSFQRGLSGVRIEAGKLVGRIDCPGYMVATLDESVSGDDYPVLEITMATTAGKTAQFYWATADRPRMGEPMSVRFKLRSDGTPHTYRLNLRENDYWAGKMITQIRLNPVRNRPGTGSLSADWQIDRIGPSK